MFENFKRHFLPDSDPSPTGLVTSASVPPDAAELFAVFGGSSFNGGLYRVVWVSDLDTWASRISYAFPEFKGRNYGDSAFIKTFHFLRSLFRQ